MSLPPDSDVFESGIESSKPSPAIHTLIREYLEAVRSDMKMSSGSPPTPPPATISSSESAVLINELGEYFSRTARMWSSLTDSLMNGPHIDSAVSDVLEASSSKTRFVDIHAATNMDLEITRLRKIRDLTVRYSQEVQEIWRPVPLPVIQPPQNRTSIPIAKLVSPDHNYSRSDLSSLNDYRMGVPRFSDHNAMSSSQMDVDPAHSPLEDNDSESDDDEELFKGIDMESLKQRGKGNYTCPKGLRCEKGGVENGQLVVFDRNSAFLQHLNKHRRPWVCELPGCPNPLKKRKFARRDGLERHKATVKHFMVTPRIIMQSTTGCSFDRQPCLERDNQ